jgi:hypothetical protein
VQLPRLRGDLADARGDHKEALEISIDYLALRPFDVARRLRVAKRLQQVGSAVEALAQIGGPPLATQAERVARVDVLMQLGQWNDVADALREWPADSPRATITRAKREMRLNMLKFDFAAARRQAEHLLAENPDDVDAAKALAQSAVLTFDPDSAWSALRKVPISPAGDGPALRGTRRLRHLLGQIVNELRLRPGETQALATTTGLPGEMQAKEAARFVRNGSDSTGAALALLIGLARSKLLEEGTAAHLSQQPIPRTLHQYWDRNPPTDIRSLMDETAEINASYVYRRWDDDGARHHLAAVNYPGALRAYREAKNAASRADIFRLAILFTEGGAYLDADDSCLRPVETLLPAGANTVFYQEQLGSIGNNFIAATPGHPLIRTALDAAIHAVLEGAGESIWLTTGPGMLSRVVADAIAGDSELALPPSVHLIPLGPFRHTVQACCRAGYKRGARHWSRAA